jgi:hypothetical protein
MAINRPVHPKYVEKITKTAQWKTAETNFLQRALLGEML